jgi:hypothetical protein
MLYANLVIFLLIVFAATSFTEVFAEPTVHLDKSAYYFGDTIRISGSVQYEEGMAIIVQIRSASDIVSISQSLPKPSGSYVYSLVAEGPKWQQSGTYIVIVSYNEQSTTKTFQFLKPDEKPVEKTAPVQEKPQTTTEPQEKESPPKIIVKGFPDSTIPPQYYYDRYNTEPEFRKWFDSQFPGKTIQEVVGYNPTHVPGFPSPQFSPQYYIKRYENESRYREWFDSQFPGKTIYEIVGISEESQKLVPSWLKQYAKLWSDEDIDDSLFAEKISDLIRQRIITINEELPQINSQDRNIPGWFKNIAKWYSEGNITENDFLVGIQYLIEHRIIVV